MNNYIAPWQYFAHHPEALRMLTPLQLAAVMSDPAFRLRVNQWPANDDWHYLGYIAARGLGKTHAAAMLVQQRVDRGEAISICLIAQDEQRTHEICVDKLIELCPPWNKVRRQRDQLLWDNGAVAYVCTPEAPGKIRGANYDLTWMTEIVGWSEFTGLEAFENATTATRMPGRDCRVIWDTTAKGMTPILSALLRKNERDPNQYPIIRGTTFDNPLLGQRYLRSVVENYGVGTRRYREEILGEVFDNAEGAIWQASWINDNRVQSQPAGLHKLVGYDPNTSEHRSADAAGVITAGRDGKGHVYLIEDRSAKYSAETVGNVIVEEHAKGAVGVVLETNRGQAFITQNVRAAAKDKGVQVRVLTSSDSFPAQRNPSILYVREVHSRGKKLDRAEPVATLYSQGRVHHIGLFPELEKQQLTYDGSGASPNNFDAANMVIAELAGLRDGGVTAEQRTAQVNEVNRVNASLKNSYSIRAWTRSLV